MNLKNRLAFYLARVSAHARLLLLGCCLSGAVLWPASALPFPPATTTAAAAAKLKPIDVNTGFADLVDAVKPAVVNISVTSTSKSSRVLREFGQQAPQLEEFFRRYFSVPDAERDAPINPARKTIAVGSGFIIDPQGLVVTNNHVIENADSIEVVFDDGTRMPASLRGVDSKTDLALLEINADKPLPYVQFGDSEAARVGDWVVAIGNPFGLGGSTTKGIISARGRDIRSGPLDDFIQIDAPLNRGNSGGPLFNTQGEVIGVNSAIFSPNGGNVGIGFAIPSSMAGPVVAQLREHGEVQRGYLGVHIQSITADIADSLGLENPHGALVTEVVPDSPAAAAGIRSGDVILHYAGKPVQQMRDLPKLVALTSDNSTVELSIWRDGKQTSLRVKIGTYREDAVARAEPQTESVSEAELGLRVAALTEDNRQQYGVDTTTHGVVVVHVAPSSAADQKQFARGDVLKRAGTLDVASPQDLDRAVEAAKKAAKNTLLLLVQRGNSSRYVALPLTS